MELTLLLCNYFLLRKFFLFCSLNPSYDTYAQWGIEGLDPIPHYDDVSFKIEKYATHNYFPRCFNFALFYLYVYLSKICCLNAR